MSGSGETLSHGSDTYIYIYTHAARIDASMSLSELKRNTIETLSSVCLR